jgi:hypothetical protein
LNLRGVSGATTYFGWYIIHNRILPIVIDIAI